MGNTRNNGTRAYNPALMADLLYEARERCGKRLRQIAREMGDEEKYLSRKLNPADEGAHLQVVNDLFFYLAVTDLAPLDYLEACLGRVAVDLPDGAPDSREWLASVAAMAKETGEALAEVAEAVADNNVAPDEARRCVKELDEALGALARVRQRIAEFL